jgi:hypothetical protein
MKKLKRRKYERNEKVRLKTEGIPTDRKRDLYIYIKKKKRI